MAEKEIMGLRDWRLSQRHREWGGNAPAFDLDFILAEYDMAKPVGLAEYKHHSRAGLSYVREDASIRTLRALADMAALPGWVAIYKPCSWSFKVYCLNDRARAVWGDAEYTILTEREYVRGLYRLRGRTLPDDIAARLNGTHDTLPGVVPNDFDFLRRMGCPQCFERANLHQSRQEVWHGSVQ